MKRFYLIIFLASLGPLFAPAQNQYLDSLRRNLNESKEENIARVLALGELADYYGFLQFDSCLFYAAQTIELSKKLNYTYGLYLGYFSTFHGTNCQGNYLKAQEAVREMKKVAEILKKDSPWISTLPPYFSGVLYREMEDYPNAIAQFRQNTRIDDSRSGPLADQYANFSGLGITYMVEGRLDSALYYTQRGYDLALETKRYKKYFALAAAALGGVQSALKNYEEAKQLFRIGIDQSGHYNNIYLQVRNYNNLARVFHNQKQNDSCIYYAKIALQLCQSHNFLEFTGEASAILSREYELENKPDSALKYVKLMQAARDSVLSQSKIRQFQQASFDEIQRLQQVNIDKERSQNRIRTYGLSSLLLVLTLLAIALFRNSRQRRKAAVKIESAYKELKATQTQLIQSEKMASLGELTAGIAHEIQNPLNFVNNFSEVNEELIDEMEQSLQSDQKEEAIRLGRDIKANLEKIAQHGKRADAIVKGMMQHSMMGTGQKEPTDINLLADEWLRLSYHGMRAKEKSFHCEIRTDFDPAIGKINIIPQDIGKVFLNLLNNAFYSVNEKKKNHLVTLKGSTTYEPTVIVLTKHIDTSLGSGSDSGYARAVEIRISDNGMGIPPKIIEKIYQPFFTTKPTGQGTGLGLSLCYDIITKEHGGTIEVESVEGEYAEFIIRLPMN